jgi:hypothetical protein
MHISASAKVGIGTTAPSAELEVVGSVISQIDINSQGSGYTLVLADQGKLVKMTDSSAANLTIPPNSSVAFATGTQIIIQRYGAGAITIVADSGVTLRAPSSEVKIRAQYSSCVLIKIGSDEWTVMGDMS